MNAPSVLLLLLVWLLAMRLRQCRRPSMAKGRQNLRGAVRAIRRGLTRLAMRIQAESRLAVASQHPTGRRA